MLKELTNQWRPSLTKIQVLSPHPFKTFQEETVLLPAIYSQIKRLIVGLYQRFSSSGWFSSKGTFSNVWEHFWLSQSGCVVCVCVQLVIRGQGCYWKSYKAHDNLPRQRIILCKGSLVLSLRSPVHLSKNKVLIIKFLLLSMNCNQQKIDVMFILKWVR